jgi:hypothetical protein
MMSVRDDCLFFSRGEGWGCEVSDAAIAQDLVEREPEMDVTFESYRAGAATLRGVNGDVLGSELPEGNPPWAAVSSYSVIAEPATLLWLRSWFSTSSTSKRYSPERPRLD